MPAICVNKNCDILVNKCEIKVKIFKKIYNLSYYNWFNNNNHKIGK